MTIEKKLDALIDALGFDIDRQLILTRGRIVGHHDRSSDKEYDFLGNNEYQEINRSNDYKLTKRKVNGKSELHRIVREYESGRLSVSEMLNDIAKIESVSNE